jgi:hypothetical protein
LDFVLSGATRPLDLIFLRAEVFADVLWPAHFFLTAVLAAALVVGFFAIAASLVDLMRRKLTQNRIL